MVNGSELRMATIAAPTAEVRKVAAIPYPRPWRERTRKHERCKRQAIRDRQHAADAAGKKIVARVDKGSARRRMFVGCDGHSFRSPRVGSFCAPVNYL